MALSPAQLRNLPKIDLHRHLDCCMRWSTIFELARIHGLAPFPIRDDFLITNQMKDLESVLSKFLKTQKLLCSEEILTRLAFEACEDAFNDNVLMVEFRYSPGFIAEGHPHLTYEKIHSALVKGLKRGEDQFGIAIGLIGILQRVKSFQEAEKALQFFIDHKSDYVGIDLADNELGFEPKPFAPLFQRARQEGLHITVHSGESPHDLAGQWVLDAINILGAERIGHGVQSIHNPKVIEALKDKNIPLEVCPLSNWLTQAFTHFEDHPLRKLYNLGVPVTLNSDDPGIFASTLTDDYVLAHQFHGFGIEEFTFSNRTAFQHSFIPETKKSKWEKLFL